jgi:[CysO sulfur-carrier protein]-S-L-cysteine hydrolase
MELILPRKIVDLLKRELRGRRNEIGGILVAEHVNDETFRIIEVSVQRTGGSAVHFVRGPDHSREFLADFFARTGNDYRRFNYIGEWHSHPAFEPVPSGADIRAMYEIVEDADVGANFAVLIVARLLLRSSLQLSVTLFRPGLPPAPVVVSIEPGKPESIPTWLSRFCDFFRT